MQKKILRACKKKQKLCVVVGEETVKMLQYCIKVIKFRQIELSARRMTTVSILVAPQRQHERGYMAGSGAVAHAHTRNRPRD